MDGKENFKEQAPGTISRDHTRLASLVSSTEVEKLISGISEYDYATSSKLRDLKRLDRSSLTPELTRKLDDRRRVGLNNYWSRVPKSGWGTAVALAVLSLVSLLCAIAIVAAQGEPSPLTTTIPFLLPAGLGIGAAARGRHAAHHPLHVRSDEHLAIEEAYQGTGFPAEARKQPRDAEKIAYVADQIITDIRKSAAWKSPLLDEHRIRLDLGRERFEIASSAALLDKQQLSAAIDPDVLEDEGPDAERLRQAVDRSTGLITEMRASLINRVAALLAYRDELAPLDRLIKQMKTLDQLEEQQASLHQAYTQITRNELATTDTHRMTDELTALTVNLTAQIEFVRTNVINSPALGAGLTLIEEDQL